MIRVQLILRGIGRDKPFVGDACVINASDAHEIGKNLRGILSSRSGLFYRRLSPHQDIDSVRASLNAVERQHRVDMGHKPGDRVGVIAFKVNVVNGVRWINVCRFIDCRNIGRKIAAA
ncbi:hypothetical protein SDC9_193657 [bioreactor metagenome]|uniref:Uncharacterized protein n=1 Tax=bioreactor metagenome TaxID=1076179 RepID=A0A645I456_9ZZZZ